MAIIAHDIRSAHNVGSLLRTADGFGAKVYLTGYTPYPAQDGDQRLPHLVRKLTSQIHKTALGAEADEQLWEQATDIQEVLDKLHHEQFEIIALEQAPQAIPLPDYTPPGRVAILLGREVEGLNTALLKKCDKVVEIPMVGTKESFNVIEAATAAMYHCRFAK